jgi:hypothetical protein
VPVPSQDLDFQCHMSWFFSCSMSWGDKWLLILVEFVFSFFLYYFIEICTFVSWKHWISVPYPGFVNISKDNVIYSYYIGGIFGHHCFKRSFHNLLVFCPLTRWYR